MEQDTRDMAIQAISEIKSHVINCDRRYIEWQRRNEEMLQCLKEMNNKLGELNNSVVEARGAAKFGKIIVGAISAVGGVLGGLGSHIVIK